MNEEKNAQVSEENNQPVEQPVSNDVDSRHEVIQEAKKYRQRAQSVEKELEELKAQLAKKSEDELAEKEEWKTLAEKYKQERDELEPQVQKANAYMEDERQRLLADFTEDEIKDFGHLPLSDLTKFHKRLINKKVVKTETGNAGVIQTNPKKMMEMNKAEKRQNWPSIVQSYKNRK